MKTIRGRLSAAPDKPIGDTLDGDHPAGVAVLHVNDPFAFDEAGGTLRLGDHEYAYTGYDDDEGLIFLDGATEADGADGDAVIRLPEIYEKTVLVRVATDSGSEPVQVRVPFYMHAMVDEAIRSSADEPYAILRYVDGDYELVDIYANPKTIQGSAIVGPLPNADMSDGEPPAASPTPVTLGGLRQIFVKWDIALNKDLVEYEVHVSTSNATPPVAGNRSTLSVKSPATMVAVSSLPDGTAMTYDVDYYVAVIATDADGAAAPSAWVAGRMDRAASGDLVAGAVTTETLNSVLAIVGLLQIGGGLIELSPPTSTPDGSGGLTLGGGIVIKDPANPTGEPLVRLHPMGCAFKGRLTADIITVLFDLIINGDARLSGGSTLSISAGVPDPLRGPVWQVGPEVGQSWPATPSGYGRLGIAWDGTQWYELLARASDNRAVVRTVSTAGVAGAPFLLGRDIPAGQSDYGPGFGLAVIGSNIFYSWSYYSSGRNTLLTKTDLSGALVSQVALPAGTTVGVLGPYGTTEIVAVLNVGSGASRPIVRYSMSLAETTRVTPPASWIDTSTQPGGIAVGTFDYGSERLVVSRDAGRGTRAQVWIPAWGSTTMTEETAQSWDLTSMRSFGGTNIAWDGSNFQTIAGEAASLSKWSDYKPASDDTWSAVYVDKTSSGTTKASPATTVTVPARNYATLTLGAPPPGATGSDVWVGYAASGNAATKYKRAEALVGRTMVLAGKSTTGSTVIPTENTAGGNPADIRSGMVNGWKFTGDGLAKVWTTPAAGEDVANKAYVDDAAGSALIECRKTATQSIPSQTPGAGWTVVTWDATPAHDYGDGVLSFDGVDEFVNDSARTMLVEAIVAIDYTGATSGGRWITLRRDRAGAKTYGVGYFWQQTHTGDGVLRLNSTFELAPGDRLAAMTAQNSGAALTIKSGMISSGGDVNQFRVQMLRWLS